VEKSNYEKLMALRQKHVPQGPYNITPLFVKRAKGAVIEDIAGKNYIDFSGGIGVQNLGHCPDAVVSAIKEQAELFIHTCFHVVMYQSYLQLAEKLNELTPGNFDKKTFFTNSGAEAVENAVKVARYATKRPSVIAFENAFHGRTYMALSLTSQFKPYKQGFGPFCPEVYRMPFAYCYRCRFGLEYPRCGIFCADYLEDFFVTNIGAESVAAVILEPVQGEGGFIVPPPEYVNRIQAICEKNKILLIVDEIQSGMGRTGRLFAIEHFGVSPDILLTGKSIAAGLPLGGITGRAEIMDAPHVGGLGGTFSGNPLACAAGVAVLNSLNRGILQKAEKLGKNLMQRFLGLKEKYKIIGDVRGLGPMVGMELVKTREGKEPASDQTRQIVKQCCEKGLIILSCGVHQNVLRTLIPLVIKDDDLELGLSILEKALKDACS
jgi:4-aminobutyrate aminotransferase/(S)-3-amino-2-methylpropionate transaminase